MKKLLAACLAAALVLLSPGLGCYEAVAGTVTGPKGKGGNTTNPGGGLNNGGLNGGLPKLNITPLGLNGLTLNPNGLNPVVNPGANADIQTGAELNLPGAQLNAGVNGAVNPLGGGGAGDVIAAVSNNPLSNAVPGAELVLNNPGKLGDTAKTVGGLQKSENIKQLASPKGENKGGVLRWIFDRSKKNVVDENAEVADAVAVGGVRGEVKEKKGSKLVKALKDQKSGPSEPGQIPTPAAEKKKPGLIARIKAAFNLSDFNSSEKSYIAGQAVFLLGISVYLASLPLLVKALTGDASNAGIARMVHYWAFAGASLFAGSIVDRLPMKKVLVGAAGTRAALFGTIGLLALAGGLPWTGFLILVGANALVVSMNHLVDIDTGGAAKVFGSDKKIEKAGYVYDFIYFGMMLAVPPLIGIPMDWLDSAYGAGIGAAAGFAAFGALMTATALIYAKKVKILGQAAAEITVKTSLSLLQWPAKVWRAILGIPRGLLRFGSEIKKIFAHNWKTLNVIWNNKAILARSTMATVENFVEDALFAVVLPTFALEVLKGGATANGLLLSAVTAGGLIASSMLMSRAQNYQKKHGLYNLLKLLTGLAVFAFVPSIALWAVPSLWVAIPAVLMLKMMYQPLRSRMRALLQTSIKNDPKAEPISSSIYSLMTFFEVLAAGAGGLAFAWLFQNGDKVAFMGDNAPMKMVTISLMAISVVYVAGLRWVKKQIQTPVEKNFVNDKEQAALEKLETNLKRMGLPPYKTRTAPVEKAASQDEPTVAILSPASPYKLSIALEGARQAPGQVHLALDPSWIIKQEWQDAGHKLFLKKGLTFDADGQAVIVEYAQPRAVRYFANFYTLGANDRDDGLPLEKNLDVPQSNSVQLENVTNDKLVTRLMMAAQKVAVPATIAFLLASHPLRGTPNPGGAVQALDMPDSRAPIKLSIEQFLENYKGDEVVVKPSGPQFHSGRGVKFFARDQVEAMVDHVLALKSDPMMTPDGVVLVDERLVPPALYMRHHEPGASVELLGKTTPSRFLEPSEFDAADPKEKKDWNFRVLVARTPWDGAAVTGIFARAGAWGVPTNAEPENPADAAAVVSFDDVVAALQKQHGLLTSQAERDEFRAALDRAGQGALLALAKGEAGRQRADAEGRQAQTDFIGLDVMVVVEDGKLVPKIIEVNDHDSGGQWQLDRFHPDDQGAHSREWVATMLQRARRDALRGKRIVIVGAGYEGKRFIFERAKELGVKIILVDKGLTGAAKGWDTVRTWFGAKSKDHWAKGLVSEFIDSDNAKPAEALARAKDKLLRSAKKNGEIEGITTFWEDDVPLTASLAKDLGLPYHSEKAARSVRSKAETRSVMAAAGLPTPRFERLAIGASMTKDQMVALKEAYAGALNKVGFPAVIKPAFGAAAQGVRRIDNRLQAEEALEWYLETITPQLDPIFLQGRDMVVEQYLNGPEYDVDIVMQGGVAKRVSVTDNSPTQEPYFLATGSTLPSKLPKSQQKEIEDLAVRTAKALGLTDGVVHIEGKYTKEGARIIEANGRMGGVYVRDWVKAVWGVDLVEENLLVAAGIPVGGFMPNKPLTYLEGAFLIPAASGEIVAFALPEGAQETEAFYELRQMKKVGDRIAVPPNGFERAGMLVAKGATHAEALRNLAALQAQLRLDIK